MPIDINQFNEEPIYLEYLSRKDKILNFFKKNKDKAYTIDELCYELKMKYINISSALKRMKRENIELFSIKKIDYRFYYQLSENIPKVEVEK